MSFDPFRPDDAGDESAVFHAKATRRSGIMRAIVAAGGLFLVAVAALIAVLVS